MRWVIQPTNMTDPNPKCEVCNDEGKTTRWIVVDGNWVDDGEEDCICVKERIEEARGEMIMETERDN